MFLHGIFVFLIFNRLTHYYGIYQASIYKQKMRLIQQFQGRCNALLVKIPFDDVLLDIQVTLSQDLQALEVCSYQQSQVMGMKNEVHNHNCHSHKLFHRLLHLMLELMWHASILREH